jgi:hypothetical protein
MRPSSVQAADVGLRMFATFIVETHPEVTAVAQLQRPHLEDYKRWLLARRSGRGQARLTATTRSLRLGALRMFFLRVIEWDWPDAPVRPLLFLGEIPTRDLPLPKALDDTDAGKFLRAAQKQPRLPEATPATSACTSGGCASPNARSGPSSPTSPSPSPASSPVGAGHSLYSKSPRLRQVADRRRPPSPGRLPRPHKGICPGTAGRCHVGGSAWSDRELAMSSP